MLLVLSASLSPPQLKVYPPEQVTTIEFNLTIAIPRIEKETKLHLIEIVNTKLVNWHAVSSRRVRDPANRATSQATTSGLDCLEDSVDRIILVCVIEIPRNATHPYLPGNGDSTMASIPIR